MADTKVIVIPEGKICDYIDGKFRNDTPEEYVRQTVEKRLVNEHKYFPEQIRVEYTLQLGSRKPRADIVIFESKDTAQTQENIKIIIECKKETVDAPLHVLRFHLSSAHRDDVLYLQGDPPVPCLPGAGGGDAEA